MTLAIWYALTGIILFLLGLYGLIICQHLLRKILAANVLGSGVFLTLVAFADRRPDNTPDPVPHAMVLTGIVVAVSATALALALVRRVLTQTEEIPTTENAEKISRQDTKTQSE